MATRVARASIAVAIISVIAGAVLLLRRPVLFTFHEPGELYALPLLNPLRDQAPERAAEAMLEQLRRGETPAFLAPEIAAKERELRIRAWKLVGRRDEQDVVEVRFLVARRRPQVLDCDVSMRIRRERGEWRVVRFDPLMY